MASFSTVIHQLSPAVLPETFLVCWFPLWASDFSTGSLYLSPGDDLKTAAMCARNTDVRPHLIFSILQCKCSRCRRGDMFQYSNPYNLRNFMKMNDRCPVCRQPLNLEPGFYYGTNMISYLLALLICLATFFLWWLIIGFSLQDSRFFWWIGVNGLLLIVLQPPLMRLSRAVWLSFFVRYSPDWENGEIIGPYNVNEEQEANW